MFLPLAAIALALPPEAPLLSEVLDPQRRAGNLTFMAVGDNRCREALPLVEDRERFGAMPLEQAVAEINEIMPYEVTLSIVGAIQVITTEGLGPDCQPAAVDSPWLKLVPAGDYEGVAGLQAMFAAAGARGPASVSANSLEFVESMAWTVAEPTALAVLVAQRHPTGTWRESFLVGTYSETNEKTSWLSVRHISTMVPAEDLPKHVRAADEIRAGIADCRKRQARGEGCGESEAALRAQEWLLELARSDPSLLTPPEDSWGPDIPPVPDDFVPKIGITEPSYPIPAGFWLVDEHGMPLESSTEPPPVR